MIGEVVTADTNNNNIYTLNFYWNFGTLFDLILFNFLPFFAFDMSVR